MTKHHWTVSHHVRDDAENVFVPADDLPDAQIGDAVEFPADQTAPRTGRVSTVLDDATRGRFFTVELDPPPA